MNNEAGYSLLETLAMTTLVGLLSASAIARIGDLEQATTITHASYLEANILSAAKLARAKQLAGGLAPNASIRVDGISIPMINGYPTRAGIGDLIELNGFSFDRASGSFVASNKQQTFIITYQPASSLQNSPQVKTTAQAL